MLENKMKKSLFIYGLAMMLVAGCQNSKTNTDKIGLNKGLDVPALDGASTVEEGTAGSDAVDLEGDNTVVASITKSETTDKSPKNIISGYRAPRVGTVFYWKNNWNSLPKRLVHKVTSVNAEFSGKPAIQMNAIEDTGNGTQTFYDVKTANLLGHKDKNGKPVVIFPQVEERLRFPMKPGDKWVTNWKSIDKSEQRTTKGGGVVKVIGVESLPIAGKKLKTMKISLPLPRELGRTLKHHIWYSPKFGVVVREQISNNTFVWLKELENVKFPG